MRSTIYSNIGSNMKCHDWRNIEETISNRVPASDREGEIRLKAEDSRWR
jgi:hypothetical protein